jgi:hypothetical protein
MRSIAYAGFIDFDGKLSNNLQRTSPHKNTNSGAAGAEETNGLTALPG